MNMDEAIKKCKTESSILSLAVAIHETQQDRIKKLEAMILTIVSIPAVCDIEDSITIGMPAEVRNPITDARQMVTK